MGRPSSAALQATRLSGVACGRFIAFSNSTSNQEHYFSLCARPCTESPAHCSAWAVPVSFFSFISLFLFFCVSFSCLFCLQIHFSFLFILLKWFGSKMVQIFQKWFRWIFYFLKNFWTISKWTIFKCEPFFKSIFGSPVFLIHYYFGSPEF